jgi:hypothetical protein
VLGWCAAHDFRKAAKVALRHLKEICSLAFPLLSKLNIATDDGPRGVCLTN